jgi:hypothetical protein
MQANVLRLIPMYCAGGGALLLWQKVLVQEQTDKTVTWAGRHSTFGVLKTQKTLSRLPRKWCSTLKPQPEQSSTVTARKYCQLCSELPPAPYNKLHAISCVTRPLSETVTHPSCSGIT